ncbi:MAG: DUF433 domain-containing protein [Chloroflexota bacterium]
MTETIGDESYSYIPLGNHVVRAIGVCSGRPTFKYTRIEVAFILNRIANGKTVDYIIDAYDDPHLSRGAIHEAISLAAAAFESSPLVSHPLAA